MTGPGAGAPVAPPQGIAATPIALAANTVVTVPFPTQATGRAPVPWRTPWATILNSSPFTLLVTSGGQTTQIAAFTSDKVFVYSMGNQLPLTLLPVPGSQTLIAGTQDTTAYVTWYQSEPPGTYPAALGSGAAQFAQNTTIINFTNAVQNNNTTTTRGPFSSQGFSALVLHVDSASQPGPLQVIVQWFDSTGVNVIAQRGFILGDNVLARLNVAMPHMGPIFQIITANNAAPGAINYSINALQVTYPVAGFVQDNENGLIVRFNSSVTANSALTVYGSPSGDIFSGPCVWSVKLTSATVFDIRLETEDVLAAWTPVLQLTPGSMPDGGAAIPVLVPPTSLRIRAANPTGVAYTLETVLTNDSWRTA